MEEVATASKSAENFSILASLHKMYVTRSRPLKEIFPANYLCNSFDGGTFVNVFWFQTHDHKNFRLECKLATDLRRTSLVAFPLWFIVLVSPLSNMLTLASLTSTWQCPPNHQNDDFWDPWFQGLGEIKLIGWATLMLVIFIGCKQNKFNLTIS